MPDRSPAASSPAPSRPALRSRPLQPMVPASRAPSGANRARFPGADGGSPSVRTVVPMTTVRPPCLACSMAANTSALTLLLPLPELVEDAAGQDDLALAGGQVEGGAEPVLALDPHLDLVRPAVDGLPDAGDGQRVADLEPVVGRLVDAQRDQALGDQVAAVDAGETLGEDAADAEGERGQGGVLAAGSLAVVVAADDEASVPALGPLHKAGVLLHEGVLGDRQHVGAVGHDD